MDLGLRDRVAVVAASSEGLGKAIALQFAQEGAHVAINGRREDVLEQTAIELTKKTGAQIHPVAADLSQPDGPGQLVEAASKRFGRIDAMVTNTGGPPAKPFDQLGDEEWDAAVELLLMSAIRLMRPAIPHLREVGGSIVNLTSYAVKQPLPGLALSNSVRAAVVGLGKTLSDELAPQGVRINNVAPGPIWTERSKYLASVRAESAGISLEEAIRQTEAAIPLGRYGKPEEVAALTVFLSSPRAGYITGTTTLVDGGAYRGFF